MARVCKFYTWQQGDISDSRNLTRTITTTKIKFLSLPNASVYKYINIWYIFQEYETNTLPKIFKSDP